MERAVCVHILSTFIIVAHTHTCTHVHTYVTSLNCSCHFSFSKYRRLPQEVYPYTRKVNSWRKNQCECNPFIFRSDRNHLSRQLSHQPPEFYSEHVFERSKTITAQFPSSFEQEPVQRERLGDTGSQHVSGSNRYTLESAEVEPTAAIKVTVSSEAGVNEVVVDLEGESGESGNEVVKVKVEDVIEIDDKGVKDKTREVNDEGVKDVIGENGGEGVKDILGENGGEVVKDVIGENGGEGVKDVIGESGGEVIKDVIGENDGEGVKDVIGESGGEVVKDVIGENGGEVVKLEIPAREASIDDDLRDSPAFQFITRPDLYKFAKVRVNTTLASPVAAHTRSKLACQCV